MYIYVLVYTVQGGLEKSGSSYLWKQRHIPEEQSLGNEPSCSQQDGKCRRVERRYFCKGSAQSQVLSQFDPCVRLEYRYFCGKVLASYSDPVLRFPLSHVKIECSC